MARKIGSRLVGVEKLKDALSKLASEMSGEDIKDSMLRRVAIPIRDSARNRVNIRSGALRRAIFAARGDKGKTTVLVGVNYKIAPHAHNVEFGHAGPHPAPPHPYMRPAVDEHRQGARRDIEDVYRDVLKKYS